MEKSEYQRYLASRKWALLKKQVRERSRGLCERCLAGNYDVTHHLTYERAGHEKLEDLQALCEPCHQFLSAKSNVDPAKAVAMKIASSIETLSFLFSNTEFLHRMLHESGHSDLAKRLDDMYRIWDEDLSDPVCKVFMDFLAQHIEVYREAKETADYYRQET